ncbi:MAG: hypothetical protein M3441_24415 [Chloroflexota bacterium]|nr:hypothetical protein [Chloroflexota bacterium]
MRAPPEGEAVAQAAVRALRLREGARRPELYVGLGEAWTRVGSGLSRPHQPQFTTDDKIQGREVFSEVRPILHSVGLGSPLLKAHIASSSAYHCYNETYHGYPQATNTNEPHFRVTL